MAAVCGRSAAGPARPGPGRDGVRGRRAGAGDRPRPPGQAGAPGAGRGATRAGRPDFARAVAGRAYDLRPAPAGRRNRRLDRGVRRPRGRADRGAHEVPPRRHARSRGRAAVRRRRHLGQARRVRRAVAAGAHPADNRLRRGDERAAVCLPERRCPDRRWHGDAGDQRGAHRGGVRAVRRETAGRGSRRLADRGVRLPGDQRRGSGAPAAARRGAGTRDARAGVPVGRLCTAPATRAYRAAALSGLSVSGRPGNRSSGRKIRLRNRYRLLA